MSEQAVFFESQSDFHKWLAANHQQESEVWVGFYKKQSGKKGISYAEAVDEALCFGWIDGIRKRVDDDRYANRFTPRKRVSNWSSVNIKRVNELKEQGRMQPSGLQAFEARRPEQADGYSYEATTRALDGAYESQFRANAAAWAFFQAQAATYQKAANWWVMSAKKEETRQSRLAKLIQVSEQRERLSNLTYRPKA